VNEKYLPKGDMAECSPDYPVAGMQAGEKVKFEQRDQAMCVAWCSLKLEIARARVVKMRVAQFAAEIQLVYLVIARRCM